MESNINILKAALDRGKLLDGSEGYKGIKKTINSDTLGKISKIFQDKQIAELEGDEKTLYILYSLYKLFDSLDSANVYLGNHCEYKGIKKTNPIDNNTLKKISEFFEKERDSSMLEKALYDLYSLYMFFASKQVLEEVAKINAEESPLAAKRQRIGDLLSISIIIRDIVVSHDEAGDNIDAKRFTEEQYRTERSYVPFQEQVYDKYISTFQEFINVYNEMLAMDAGARCLVKLKEKYDSDQIDIDIVYYVKKLKGFVEYSKGFAEPYRVKGCVEGFNVSINDLFDLLPKKIDKDIRAISDMSYDALREHYDNAIKLIRDIAELAKIDLDKTDLFNGKKSALQQVLFDKIKDVLNSDNIDFDELKTKAIKLRDTIPVDQESDLRRNVVSLIDAIYAVELLKPALKQLIENPADAKSLTLLRQCFEADLVKAAKDNELVKKTYDFAENLLTLFENVNNLESLNNLDIKLQDPNAAVEYKVGDKTIKLIPIVNGLKQYLQENNEPKPEETLEIFNTNGKVKEKPKTKPETPRKNSESGEHNDVGQALENIDSGKKGDIVWQKPIIAGVATLLGLAVIAVLVYGTLHKLHNSKLLPAAAENIFAFLTKKEGYAAVVISAVVLATFVGVVTYLIENANNASKDAGK